MLIVLKDLEYQKKKHVEVSYRIVPISAKGLRGEEALLGRLVDEENQ